MGEAVADRSHRQGGVQRASVEGEDPLDRGDLLGARGQPDEAGTQSDLEGVAGDIEGALVDLDGAGGWAMTSSTRPAPARRR